MVLGWRGGAGHALVNLLAHTRTGRECIDALDELLLLDEQAAPLDPALGSRFRVLAARRIASAADLAQLLDHERLTQVIDLSSIGTLDCIEACDARGAGFLTTSISGWPGAEVIPLHRLLQPLLPGARPWLARASHLVGSGMNPGIVNALAFAALEALGRIVDRPASIEALAIHSLLITEEDTTEEPGGSPPGVFPMTWSPTHCLEELLEPEAWVSRDGHVAGLGHAPLARRYEARCHERRIAGFVVPHEEVITLGRRFPRVEIAFLYAPAPAARAALEAHPERARVHDWPTRRLYPPYTRALKGRDRVGVLLCSRRHGELWMGFDTDVATGLRRDTNATQLQVAAGVLAGWRQLGARQGIHFVEDLDWRAYLELAAQVLGPVRVVHDRSARASRLIERARPGSTRAHERACRD